MKDIDNNYKQIQYEPSSFNHEDSPCRGIQNVSIIVHKKKVKNRKKCDMLKYCQQPAVAFRLSRSCTNRNRELLTKHSSMPAINKRSKLLKQRFRSSDAILKKKNYFNSKFVVNRLSNYHFNEYLTANTVSPFIYPTQKKWKVYRCQLGNVDDSCCCSCNSDAMFEVMKSLYDCYKKKNCDDCNCILCGHLPREERRLGEVKKSLASVGLAGSTKERKAKVKKAEKVLRGKTKAEKEKILKELAQAGQPLPAGKTTSEKALIKKIRTELGLPPEPKSVAEKARMRKAEAAGVITPLEGKTTSQKEKILKAQAQLGVPLPEGRTASEKALIQKIKTAAGIPEGITPEKLEKAKAAGLITPLAGKSPEQREKILKGLAMQGLPLPEGKTASEQKLIDKVRAELGLPPEPKSPSIRDKHRRAADAGLLLPLEGKSPKEKERIIQGLYDMGIPLPEGRTASEKALIAKVQAGPRAPSVLAPSEKIRKAKAAGLLTPLEDKTPEQKEKILRGLAMQGIPLPEGKTASKRKLIDKVRTEIGLPPEPKSPSMRDKYAKAADAGLLQPLEGKSTREKERILQGLHDMGIPLPKGRTASEKALVTKVQAGPRAPSVLAPSEKIRKAKAAGLLTPLEDKTPEQKEKILRGLAMQGIPLPEGKTASERKLIDKVRAKIGLPPEPKSPSMRDKYAKAADAGLLQPLEGKSTKEKERILQGLHDMGIPLPKGRTASEKALITKVQAVPRTPSVLAPSEKMRKAKAAGFLTPLEDKTPEQKEKIFRGLAMQGIPLPEGKTASERKLIDKVRAEIGLPPEPKSPAMRDKYANAADAGLLQPLEGKSPREKERILQGLHNMGIPLPEGRTTSEKALIAKLKAGPRAPTVQAPSEKLRKAKAAGLLTPLTGKPPAQREKILRGLAMQGVPLPEAKTASEKMLIDKVRADLGLPPEPKTPSMRDRYTRAADVGLLQPLEGKSPREKERILQGLHDMGIPMPEGRTTSEKALIAKVKAGVRAPSIQAPSEKLRKAKAAGLLTPLEGKTPSQKEKILRGLAMQGLPLPDGKTASERKLIDKVRVDLGLPSEPKTPSMKEKYTKAANAGLLQPLEGKPPKEKERILQGLHDMGIRLPEGRTASEKALIAKVKARPREPSLLVPSEKLRKAQAAGLLTPLEGKTAVQKEKILRGLAMQGIPLPEGKTASEKKLADKVRADLGLPPAPKTASEREKYNKAAAAGLITPLEGNSPSEKEKILRGQYELGLPPPEGRTPSEKALIRQIKADERKKTRAVGVGPPALPPDQRRKLDEKTAKVVKEGKGPVDECICGLLTPESDREEPAKVVRVPSEKLRAAKAAGLLTPLEGKSPENKEKILKGLVKQGLPLPEGKTASERKLIEKVRADLGLPPEPRTRSMKEKYAKAQAKGLLTPLEGKTASQKEKILRGQAEIGLPLPTGRTPSEKALIAKIKASTVPSITTEKLRKAKAAGLLTPLEGKSAEQKEKILKGLAKSGLPLPEGKTASEKLLIKKIKADLRIPEISPSEKVRKAKTAGLLTPLEGKTQSQKERILRGRAAAGLPLPVGKTPSERALVQKIKEDTGYVTPSPSERMKKAKAAGLLTPLEGKTPSIKEKILRDRLAAGVPITEGKTPSEKEIIKKITAGEPPAVKRPSEKLRQAKAAGALTPLEGKTPEQKENILRGLVKAGLPLPEPKTASEKDLMDKIRQELGLPPEAKTPSLKEKYRKAQVAGIITPLEGKTRLEKEKILKRLHDAGIALPEGRTPSEKSMIKRIKAELPERKIPSEKIKAAKAAGLLTPLEGKSTAQKEKILRGLAKSGIPLPVPKTASEKKLITKIRTEMGLPPEPTTPSLKEKMQRAQAVGIITPLEGKTASQKEKILKGLAEAGIPLPEGRTVSEKALIAKAKAESKPPAKITSEKLRKAKEAGLLTPLTGKSPKEKEKIMRGLIEQGLPLPEAQTASEKKIADEIRKEIGLPPEPKTSSERAKMRKAQAAGIITPLQGKTPSQKERILRGMAEASIPLPEGRTASERALIKKVQAEVGTPPSRPISRRRLGPPALPPEERAKLDKKSAKVMKEGKGPSDECICNLLTPESEKEKAPAKIPSEKIQKAKAAGLLTPLEGKTAAQKEKIIRGLAKEGLQLPEAKTASEKKITDKVRKDLGLPPELKTPSMKEKYEKAAAAGVLVPLEGLSPAEKERVLRAQADLGIPIPEGRTKSEKALVAKVKAETKAVPLKIPSQKIRKAKAAGLLTPLEGKTAAQKEKIIRGLAKEGLPLPEAKTASEKKITDKVLKELGLPPEPKTLSMKEKYEKAAAAGVLVPLEGLSPAEKERVLRAQADLGIPLPEGRTTSEKALIVKVKAETKAVPLKIPSEKIQKAKAAGLLTPLEGKTAAQKEKIIRGLAKEGLPLPEAKTDSEKKITDKVRKDLGLPPEPKTPSMKDKYEKAAAAGVLVPLEGLSPAEKERVLRAQADLGIKLPEGRTKSEKALIAKVNAETKAVPLKIPSEKIRKAKTAGLLTPLEGKTAAQKEKIIRGLAKEGLPLPEAKTASVKKNIDKVRKELGLPPEPKTPSMKEKYEKAAAAGVLMPLEGLSPAEKKRILRAQADLGIPLPEGRTASEKELIAKINAEQEASKVSSEKFRKAKAVGLLTPLEGKTKSHKEKILKKLIETGIPLPEGKTPSEKELIHKVRTELGKSPPAKTASEKAIVRKARKDGLLTPLEGKTIKEKERILKGLAEAGLPIPEGKTASEKELVKKVRTEAGLPPEPTPSEKRGEIKTKSKKIGVTPSKKLVKGVGAITKSKAGIGEEYEDIIKTTTCDRGCGCDKKKIRFKHSYVKIRVTSPDISSLCPCPNECLPGVKAGAFIDNEGIKVTVGRVDGVTSYTSQFSNHILEPHKNIITLYNKILTNSFSSNTSIDTVDPSFDNTYMSNRLQKTMYDDVSPPQRSTHNEDKVNYDLSSILTYTSDSCVSHTSLKTYNIESDKSYLYDSTSPYEKCTDESDRFIDTSRYSESSEDIYRNPASISCTSNEYTIMERSSHGSFDSILVIKSESSLSLSTSSSGNIDVISVISFSNSSCVSSSTHYLYRPTSSYHFSDITVEDSECLTNKIDYTENYCSGDDTLTSESYNVVNEARYNRALTRNIENGTVSKRRKLNDYLTYRLSQARIDETHNIKRINTRKTNNAEPVIVINNLDSEHDITTMVDQLLSNNEFSDASSIFVVVPTSDDNDSDSFSGSLSSTICIQLSEHYSTWRQNQSNVENPRVVAPRRNSSTSRGLKISAKGKKFCMEGMQETATAVQKKKTVASSNNKETVASFHNNETVASFHKKENTFTYKLSNFCKQNDKTKNKLCQISTPKEMLRNVCHAVSTDTTADRPCCCAPKKNTEIKHQSSKHRCVANVVSELITPLLVNQGLNCAKYRLPKINVNQQASFMSINQAVPVTPCHIPPCTGHPGCHHPSDMNQIPFGTPMPEPVELRKAPAQKAQPCQCSPEKLKELLEQAVKAGKTLNVKSIGCGGAANANTPRMLITGSLAPKTESEEDCSACSHPKYKDGIKMQCTCSGKKKTVKLRALCPCEQHQPPVSKTIVGPKTGTRSLGCQCCVCEDSTLPAGSGLKGRPGMPCKGAPMGQLEVIGPSGGLALIEPGGTYTQAGMRQLRNSTSTENFNTPRKDCACKGKRGKKKKNIICECPPMEPEPEPEPDINLLLAEAMTFSYEDYVRYQLMDQRQAMKQRSDMTQTYSGFKMFKKKKPPPEPQAEFTVEDAVRYYAAMNPDLLRDLVPPPQQFREGTDYKDCSCEDEKPKKTVVKCACPYDDTYEPPELTLYGADGAGCGAAAQGPCEEPKSAVEDEGPFRGFKFSMGGKGSGSKGLSGVCCFDMIQATNKSRLKRRIE